MNKSVSKGVNLLFFGLIASVAIQSAWGSTASVVVNGGGSQTTVPAAAYGMNTAIWDSDLINSTTLPGQMSADGITTLRFPGGSTSDCYHWATHSSTPFNPSIERAPAPGVTNYVPAYMNSNTTFQNWLKTVVDPMGAKPIITVNYGSNSAGTGGGDPNEAAAWVAAWVQHAKDINNSDITYWEIGNEVYGNGYYGDAGWEFDLHYPTYFSSRYHQPALSPTSYGQNVVAYVNAMKAQFPNIKCGAVLMAHGDWTGATVADWNSNVLSACGSKIDFVSLHWYPHGTTDFVLANPSTIAAAVAATRADINKYCGSNAPNVQIKVTETNGNENGQMDCSMFIGDAYLSWLEQGIQNVYLWHKYLSLNVTGVPDGTPDANYWGIKMASMTARPGDRFVPAMSDNALLRVHAARRYDGGMSVLLMNEDPSNDNTATVSIAGVSLSSNGTCYKFDRSHFSGTQPETQQYTTNGPTQSSISGVGNRFTITVRAYSETLVIIPASVGADLIANGLYMLVGLNSGMAIEDNGWSQTPGKQIDQWTADHGANLTWMLTNLGGNTVTLRNVANGQMLDVNGGSQASCAAIIQWPYNGYTNQQWMFSR